LWIRWEGSAACAGEMRKIKEFGKKTWSEETPWISLA